jgi:hypothetical protein
MNRQCFLRPMIAIVAFAGVAIGASSAFAIGADFCDCDCCACVGPACDNRCCECGYMLPVKRSRWYNWNRNYAHTEYGQPVALVVPPTANLQTNWGWGVASSRISRIEHQFQRNFPGYGQFGGPFRATPVWPSDTSQFGVYYVRGPW